MSYVDTLFRFRGTLSKHVEEFEKDIRDVALEEGSHFILLSNRLKELNYVYGCMPVIPKLTYAIKQTEHSLLDRIGVISLMHEGRGVQAVEKLITQLQQIGDHKSVEVVRVIQRDEFKHFELGWKWFFKICELQSKEPSV